MLGCGASLPQFFNRLTMPPHSNASRDHPVYFLLHIPKTAGQTLQVHLAGHCAPGMFWQSRRRVRRGGGARPGDLPDFARARVICGHHIGRSLERFFPGRPVRRILLLRDPLELQISLYNWQMMDSLAKGLGTYSFELHLQALPRNFIAHFLLSRWLEIPWPLLMVMADERKYRLLNRMLADFWFVGAHTDCDRLIEAIGPELGVPPLAGSRNTAVELQAQTGWRLVSADALPPAKREAIRAQHRLDHALWENWRAAGFDPAANRPRAFKPDGQNSFLAHEIIRPWFALGRSIERRRGWRRRAGEPADARLARANRARNAGAWDDAARYYCDVLQALPSASAIWVQYGHALKESGRGGEAEQAYRRSISLSPDTADTHLQLGHLLKLQGRVDEAVEAYLHSVRLDAGQRHAGEELIGLGWTAERIERLTAATASADP
ncbi:MAG: hypothetical protein ACREE9_12010 [Stellaceae bacterium]